MAHGYSRERHRIVSRLRLREQYRTDESEVASSILILDSGEVATEIVKPSNDRFGGYRRTENFRCDKRCFFKSRLALMRYFGMRRIYFEEISNQSHAEYFDIIDVFRLLLSECDADSAAMESIAVGLRNSGAIFKSTEMVLETTDLVDYEVSSYYETLYIDGNPIADMVNAYCISDDENGGVDYELIEYLPSEGQYAPLSYGVLKLLKV